jgi:hypothetical protein
MTLAVRGTLIAVLPFLLASCAKTTNVVDSRKYCIPCSAVDPTIILTDDWTNGPKVVVVCPGQTVTWHYPNHKYTVDFNKNGYPFAGVTATIPANSSGDLQSPGAVDLAGRPERYDYTVTVTTATGNVIHDPHIIVLGGGSGIVPPGTPTPPNR